MTIEQLVIALIRVAGSLPVLRWPFYGALLAVFIDLSDLFWMDLLHLGGVPGYQAFDKRLDLVYMAAFLAVALRWPVPRSAEGRGLERRVALGLFAYRLLGLAAFEVTHQRALLLAFPNVFEFWFILIAARDQFTAQPGTAAALEAGRASSEGAAMQALTTPAAAGARSRARTVLPAGSWTPRQAVPWLIGLTLLKFAQEYLLHVNRWLDRYSFFEFWGVIWRALTPW